MKQNKKKAHQRPSSSELARCERTFRGRGAPSPSSGPRAAGGLPRTPDGRDAHTHTHTHAGKNKKHIKKAKKKKKHKKTEREKEKVRRKNK